MRPKLVKITVVSQYSYDDFDKIFDFGSITEDGSLDRMIASLQAIRNLVPPEYRESACAVIDHDLDHPHIDVCYWRPETDEERTKRLERWADAQCAQEDRERSEYERLKAKFG